MVEMLERAALKTVFDLDAEAAPVRRLMKRYGNVPMSLADACLVRMSEISTDAELITLERDFSVYRKGGRGVILLRAPWQR